MLPNFPGAIQPITFAAPTAGNSDLAISTTSCSRRRDDPELARCHPARLLRPRRHQRHLRGQHAGYARHHLARRPGHGGALDITEASYVQPSQGQQILPGISLSIDAIDWYAQALHQHHLATYLALLTGTQVDGALPQPSVTHATKARLIKRIGSSRSALTRLGELARLIRPRAAARSPRRSRRASAAASSRACARRPACAAPARCRRRS